MAELIRGEKVANLSKRTVCELVGSREELPPEWEIHPKLCILPRCYVRTEKVTQLFSSAKDYLTCLVKEYEAMVKIARTLEEEMEFSAEEVQDIVNAELRSAYPGRMFKSLTPEEKCRTAVGLNNRMGLTARQLAQALHTSELAISQAIRSKDYGIR